MPQSCQPGDLAVASACIGCLSEKQQLMVQTYLLAQLAGVTPNAGALVAASIGFQNLSMKQLQAIQASLMCQINGGTLP
jgi:hypothetical protein